jgi:hypothetical protein
MKIMMMVMRRRMKRMMIKMIIFVSYGDYDDNNQITTKSNTRIYAIY